MERRGMILVLGVLLLAVGIGLAIQTGQVEMGINGAYDGTVWIARDTSGSLVFRDPVVGTSVTLQQLVGGRSDHGTLSGLGDDDHSQYMNGTRHWQTHGPEYNAELPIPPDVGNNVTLGGHILDGSIHILRESAEIVSGAWRFTGTPVFAPALRLETVAPNPEAWIGFGTGYDAPRFSYLSNLNEFEFTRPIRATSGSLTDMVGSRIRVSTNLDGRGGGGVPSATLTNFVSVNGIASGNLLDRSDNEDIAGQWDFLAPVRVFGNLQLANGTATGTLSAMGITLTTQTAMQSGQPMSYVETTSSGLRIKVDKNGSYPEASRRVQLNAPIYVGGLGAGATRGLDLSGSGLSGSGDYPLYIDSNNYWRSDGQVRTSGRLGVNATPDATVHVVGDGSNYLRFLNDLGVSPAGNKHIACFTRIASGGGNAGFFAGYYADGSSAKYTYLYAPGGLDFALQTYTGGVGSNRIYIAASTGNVGIADESPASLFTVGNGDKFQVDGSGNVTMAANAKQAFPDGTDAPFIVTFNAGSNYYEDARMADSPSTRSLTGLEFTSDATAFVGFPVPNEQQGANVVLDRITVYCEQVSGSGYIDAIYLMDDSNSAVAGYTTNITGNTQWLTAPYTMDDSKSYVIKLEIVVESGVLRISKFKVEHHLQ